MYTIKYIQADTAHTIMYIRHIPMCMYLRYACVCTYFLNIVCIILLCRSNILNILTGLWKRGDCRVSILRECGTSRFQVWTCMYVYCMFVSLSCWVYVRTCVHTVHVYAFVIDCNYQVVP